MNQETSYADANVLLRASDSELMALLGLQALPLLKSPSEVLVMGRSGDLYGNPEQLGGGEFEHGTLVVMGKAFLNQWAAELQKAICSNGELYDKLRKTGSTETNVLVAVCVSGIASAIPTLAAFSGLLTVIGILLIKTGVDAFCKMLSDKNSPS